MFREAMGPRATRRCPGCATSATTTTRPPTAKRRKLLLLAHSPRPATTTSAVAAALSPTLPPTSAAAAPARLSPPSSERFAEFEALWLAERAGLSLGRTAASWVLRDVEAGALPCDARLLARRARALAAAGSGGGGGGGGGGSGGGRGRGRGGGRGSTYDGRALLQTHPGALALDADELRGKLSRVLQLLPAAAREDPTGLAMAALSPLAFAPPPPGGAAAAPPAAAALGPSPERVALAHEELAAVVSAAFWDAGGVRMGPRLFAFLFDQQQQPQQQQPQKHPSSSLAAGLAALSRALGGPELASAALERAPCLSLASDDGAELERRVEWLRVRLGVGTEARDQGDGDDWADDKQQRQQRQQRPSLSSPQSSSSALLLPARLAAALSTASFPDASAGRSIATPARSTPRDPADLPIRSLEALSRAEYAGRSPPHAVARASAPLAVGPVATLDAALASAARLLRRRAGWPPGAAVRFMRAYPGALAWDWSPGGPCDAALAQVQAAAAKRGGRWGLALRTSPAAVAAALASDGRARRRLRYLGRAPGALPGVGLRRALAMPEVDFLEACPGYSMWRRLGMGDEEEEEEGEAPSAARQRGSGLRTAAAPSDLVLLGDLREGDRML